MQIHVGFDWLGVQLESYLWVPARQMLLCRQSPIPVFGLWRTLGKVLQSRKNAAPKRLKAAGGSRSWGLCSCRGDAGHIGCQPRQTWQLCQCLLGVSPGWQGCKAWQNFLPMVAGREVGSKKAPPARRVPVFTKHCHGIAATVPSKAQLGCLDVVSVKEQCCWHLSQGLTGDLWIPQQNNTLPSVFYCHATVVHFIIPCTEHWLCWLSAYFFNLSRKHHRYTLILSSLIFAYPPWIEGYLNRSLLLKTQICMSDYAKSC